MALRDKLLTRPRETSGSRSANRFDFQKDWALCHLLELQDQGHQYVLIFEHHEDIIVVDSDTDPQAVDLFQVKTYDKNAWKMTGLLKQKLLAKGKKAHSIFGKLYANRVHFDSHTRSLNLVTNAKFDLKLGTGDKCGNDPKVCVKDLCDEHRKKIVEKVKKEHGLTTDPDFAPIAYLIVTDLSLNGHTDHAKGKLVTFLAKHRPESTFSTEALYQTLYDEIKRKTNCEKEGLDFNGLLTHKSFSRATFTRLLRELPETKRFENVWQAINTQLTTEGMNFSEILDIRNDCTKYELQRFNSSNIVLDQLRDAVAKEVARMKQAGMPTLRRTLEEGATAVQALKITGAEVFGTTYLKAMFLFEIYGY